MIPFRSRTDTFRAKALIAEHRAKNATDPELNQGWEELAIEWHAMAKASASQKDRNSLMDE
jgi:hypothetical protein